MQWTKLRLDTGISPYFIDLPVVGAASTDSYILKAVDGLGPPDMTTMIQNPRNQKPIYLGRTLEPRQIILRIELQPNYTTGETVSDLRERLYSMITMRGLDTMLIRVMNGSTTVVQTRGYVSKFESSMFTRTPEVQITIDCLSAYLEAPTASNQTPSQTGNFTVNNPGTAPSGFRLEATFTSSSISWGIQSTYDSQKLEVSALAGGSTNALFSNGDQLAVDTRPGARRIGTQTYMLGYMRPDSVWLMLHPGDNTFTRHTSPGTWRLDKIQFLPLYWGI